MHARIGDHVTVAVGDFYGLLNRLATMEAGVRAAERLLKGVTCYPDDPMVKALNAATELLETEVPDGNG